MSDHHWGGLPEARVLRDGSRPVATPVGEDLRRFFRPGPRARLVMSYVLGLWPLLLVSGLAMALVWSAGFKGSP